ncbi:MAG: hypothetical protein JSU94_11855 [Phycisphaerales bacterium]|nr:MAG: hypothetical protein JSU94_11855 [Phycisphaerales bacterium]
MDAYDAFLKNGAESGSQIQKGASSKEQSSKNYQATQAKNQITHNQGPE